MNARIFYFSGTGNSLAVARRIAGALQAPDPAPVASVKGDPEVGLKDLMRR